MNDITLRIIEGLIIYDIFKILLQLFLTIVLGITQGDNNGK